MRTVGGVADAQTPALPGAAARRFRLAAPVTATILGAVVLALAGRMVAAYAARLKDAADLESVRGDLASVVHQALEPAHTSLWISRPGAPAPRHHDRGE